MLTSSYGKTCEGVHDLDDVVKEEKDYIDYIYKNKVFISEIRQMRSKYLIKERVEVID